MIIKINLKIWKSSLISGLWFGIVQFLNRNIQAWRMPLPHPVRWHKKLVTIMNSFSWKLVPIILKILFNVTKYFSMICSCHNWQNKRKATDVRWRRKICDQVTALHTGIIDHLFLIFSFQICIAPPVLTKIWCIFCQITEIHIPSLRIMKFHVLLFLTNQKEDCMIFFFDK